MGKRKKSVTTDGRNKKTTAKNKPEKTGIAKTKALKKAPVKNKTTAGQNKDEAKLVAVAKNVEPKAPVPEKPVLKPVKRSKAVDFFSSIFSGEDDDSSNDDEDTVKNKKNSPKKVPQQQKDENVEDADEVKEEVRSSDEENEDNEVELVGIGVRPKRNDEDVKEEIKEELLSDDNQEVECLDDNIMLETEPGNNDTEVNSDSDKDRDLDGDDDDEEEGDVNEEPTEIVETTRTAIREELSNMSFEELLQLKNKMGTKQYNEAMFGKQQRGGPVRVGNKKRRVFKRENKNRPRELPARVHVPKVREVVHVKKYIARDPRFEEGCGELVPTIWDKNYEFLKEIQQQEAKELAKTVKTIEDPEKRLEVRKYLQKLKNKEKSNAEKEKLKLRHQKELEENKKRLAEGKKPFYMKKSTRKLVDLAEKYEELKSTGKLEKYLKKKRKKNLIRDKSALKIGK